MSEHVHLTQTKWIDGRHSEVHTVARRKGADTEIEIARSMGYEVEARYCGDLACLGPEPPSRYDSPRD